MDVGGPQVGEVTRGGSPHLSCTRDQIKMRDYMNRRVTSPTWSPPPPCKQALKALFLSLCKINSALLGFFKYNVIYSPN